MEAPLGRDDISVLYTRAVQTGDINKIKELIDSGYLIEINPHNTFDENLLASLKSSDNLTILKLLYPFVEEKERFLISVFYNSFNSFRRTYIGNNYASNIRYIPDRIKDLDVAKWAIEEYKKLTGKELVTNNGKYVTEAIEVYDEKKLKFLTDLGIISGYIDKNGKLLEDYRATLAYFNINIPYPRYKETNRPITKMSYTSNNCSEKGLYLPVVRYRSLYWRMEEQKACGTFYFYEPDSSSFLNLGNVLISANKIDAALQLETERGVPVDLSQTKSGLENLKDYVVRSARDETSIFKEISYILKNEKEIKMHLFPNSTNLLYEILAESKEEIYVGKEIVGDFDYLDRYICGLARELNYDTILLQREPGEYRAVTEIYDIRPRDESFNSICKNKLNWSISNTNYPAIWFSDYGFVEL